MDALPGVTKEFYWIRTQGLRVTSPVLYCTYSHNLYCTNTGGIFIGYSENVSITGIVDPGYLPLRNADGSIQSTPSPAASGRRNSNISSNRRGNALTIY